MQPKDGAYKTYHGERYDCSECALFKPAQCFRVVKGKRHDKCKEHEVVPCAACHRQITASELDEETISNHFRKQTNVICSDCGDKGCTTRDPTMHKCMGACQTKLGRGRFEKNQWDSFVRKTSKTIVCISCLKAENAREKRIAATLRQKDAWNCLKRCTENFHAEQCPLNPIKHTALPVWRGMNKGITLDDLEFLKKRPRK